MDGEHSLNAPVVHPLDLQIDVDAAVHLRFDRTLQTAVREARLLGTPPWVRSLGRMTMDVKTEGWRFLTPPRETESIRPRIFMPRTEKEDLQPTTRTPK